MTNCVVRGKNLTKSFGGLCAVKNVDFEVFKGEILGLIGPNGAGKTTLLNCICGLAALNKGELTFLGQDITCLKPFKIARLGIGRAFQVVKPFEGMTVKENVLIGGLFGKSRGKEWNFSKASDLADRALDFVGLLKRKDESVTNLNISGRKRLELARALAMQPVLLLLDEVMAGLNPVEIDSMMELIRKINADGTTIILVEHIMKVVMGISNRVMVLHFGEKIALAEPGAVVEDPTVIEAYLGERYGQKFTPK